MIASQGRYSILQDDWIQHPGDAPEVDERAIQDKADRITRTIDAAIEIDDQERLEALMERLKCSRDEGIADEGEYSFENLVYKELRRRGALNRLKEAALREYDEALSYSCQCGGDRPARYSKSDWIPYQGPQGGKGWQHTRTGRIEYGDQPPGEDETADMEPDMGAEPEGVDDEPDPWGAPSEPEIDVVGQKGVTEGQIQDAIEPEEPPAQAPQPESQWQSAGDQLWRHRQTGETVMSKEAPSLSRSQDIAAQARAAGPAKRPPEAQPPAGQPEKSWAGKAFRTMGMAGRMNTATNRPSWEQETQGTASQQTQSGRPVSAAPQAEPPRPPGTVRMYHGGTAYEGGTRWLTQDKNYAQGYADKSGGMLHYVDVREDHPALQETGKSFDDTGTGQKAPYNPFDAPEDIASQLKPLSGQSASSAAPQPSAPSPAPKAIRGDHPAAKKLDALPDGTQLFGYTKETPEGLGMSVWTKDDDAIGTNQLIKDHQTPEHQAELKSVLQSAPKPQAKPAAQTPKPPRPYEPHESAAVSSASAIFGIAPGDIGNQRQMENFVLRTARNTGYNPDTVAGDRTDRTVAAALHLSSLRPHLDAVIGMARGYGWGGGSGREVAHSARHAGLYLVKAAAQRGYDPAGNTEQEHIAGAISFLQQHEQEQASQQHSRQQAVSEGLRQLLTQAKQHVGSLLSGQRKITPMDIAVAAIGFYMGYRMVRSFRRRWGRRR